VHARSGRNPKKHGVDFREAATLFDDPLSVAFLDDEHSVGELRFLIIGMSALARSSAPEQRQDMRKPSMKETNPIPNDDDMRAEYDFASMKGGVRGKYVDRVRESTNIVLIEPEVTAAFPTEQAVNEAL
jgi:hypothetical protein